MVLNVCNKIKVKYSSSNTAQRLSSLGHLKSLIDLLNNLSFSDPVK